MQTYELRSPEGQRVTFTIKKNGSFVVKVFKLNYRHIAESVKHCSAETASKRWKELINQGYKQS